jgi:hypothetical protein
MSINADVSICEEFEVIIATALEGYPAQDPAHDVSYQSVEKFAPVMPRKTDGAERLRTEWHV